MNARGVELSNSTGSVSFWFSNQEGCRRLQEFAVNILGRLTNLSVTWVME